MGHRDDVDPSSAPDEITSNIYRELRVIAHAHLRRLRPGDTLNTTALVHEAYLRLADRSSVEWDSRAHFMALASRSMRYIIIDFIKHRKAQKRGGGMKNERLDGLELAAPERIDLLELNDSLERLESEDARMAAIVEQHFFGGMAFAEISQGMRISERTVRREWKKARMWLYRDMETGA